GNTGYSELPTAGLFEARDGRHISLGVVQDNQFTALAKLLGREDWLTDPRFASADLRRANFAEMTAQLCQILATRDAADWERMLSEAGIPCGMIRRVNEAVDLCSPAGLLDIEIDSLPGTGRVSVPNAGFRMEPGCPGTSEPPPRIDENREEILAWLAAELV
ncbi:MAG TPA: CoA transferase, partial [Paracoccaceae bacterium]|nr:CoA transferase [Paracoccaceae bacterium]